MKFTLFLILAVLTHVTFAQDLLLMRDGKHIQYKKLKYDEGYFDLTLEDKRKIKVSKDNVTGFYDSRLQKVTYKKPVVADNENSGTSFFKNDTVNRFQTLERKMAGKIILYKKEVAESYRNNGTNFYNSTTYYYAEKGDEFKNVWITGLGSKKDDLVSLRSLVHDEPAILQKIESREFDANEKNMLKIISEYNLKNFAKPSATDYRNLGTVGFYTSVGPKLKETIRLSVNDSIEYTMPKTHYPLAVKLPLSVPSKVCVTSEGETYCDLIQPIQFNVEYYELAYFPFDKSFEIKYSTVRDAENALIRARSK